MKKVIPQGMNYADVKPEVIEHDVQVAVFRPVQTGTFQGNDVIRFQIQGNGMLDPYSTYLQFTLTSADPGVNPNAGEIKGQFLDSSAHSVISRLQIRVQGQDLEDIVQYDVLARMINDQLYSREQKELHHPEGFGTTYANNMEVQQYGDCISRVIRAPHNADPVDLFFGLMPVSPQALAGHNRYDATTHQDTGKAFSLTSNAGAAQGFINGGALGTPLNSLVIQSTGRQLTFTIPLYSSILGVLMPQKKLLPLSLMNIELELTVNPYAMYATPNLASRAFTLQNVELHGHVLLFEQEVHRSLEAVVAEHGIFIHLNTFRLAPVSVNQGGAGSEIAGYAQVNQHHKSISSLHFVFMYEIFRANASAKKLQFVTHNLTELQVRNGIHLIPNEAIRGNMGNSLTRYGHTPFLIEMNKAWGKMHDPTTDGAINRFNYSIDQPIAAFNIADTGLRNLAYNTGRCQYGISFEGEQLMGDGSALSGKKGMVPFDINFKGTKTNASNSVCLIYCRINVLLFIRPDLVVQVLGL